MERIALVIAGGIGSRLWPISTLSKSKQFINLYNDYSLIQNTIKRLNKVFLLKNIYVVGSINQKDELLRNLKNINRENILLEPKLNKTACAIYYGLSKIYEKHKDCVVCIFPSDHYIGDEKEFIFSLNEIIDSTLDKITIFGVKPERPDPKFGYLVSRDNNLISFVEKPSIHIAKKIIHKGGIWSIGIYIGYIRVFMDLYRRYLNDIYLAFKGNDIDRIYNDLMGVSFEKEVIEKHPSYFKVYCGSIKWMDVGSFEGLDKIIKKGKKNNNVNANNKFLKSSNCTLISTDNKKIYAVGVNDLMVIENDDTILIVKKNMFDSIEKLKEEIK